MNDTREARRGFLKAGAVGAVALAAANASAADEPKPQPVPRTQKSTLDGMSVDVLVVGGGPAGIGAALGAAKAGADTLLIENHAFFGGVGAWCLGMPINQMRPGGKARSKVHELVIDKLKAYGEQAVRIGTHDLWCNVDYLKVAVLDALDEVGCKYLVHTQAVDAVVENNRIAGVVVGTKQGLATIRAKAIVDCTGDADIAHFRRSRDDEGARRAIAQHAMPERYERDARAGAQGGYAPDGPRCQGEVSTDPKRLGPETGVEQP